MSAAIWLHIAYRRVRYLYRCKPVQQLHTLSALCIPADCRPDSVSPPTHSARNSTDCNSQSLVRSPGWLHLTDWLLPANWKHPPYIVRHSGNYLYSTVNQYCFYLILRYRQQSSPLLSRTGPVTHHWGSARHNHRLSDSLALECHDNHYTNKINGV